MNHEQLFLSHKDPLSLVISLGGGKAGNLAKMASLDVRVPKWFCVSVRAFDEFVKDIDIASIFLENADFETVATLVEEAFVTKPLPKALSEPLLNELKAHGLLEDFVAVRSSGLDEDSKEFSFAGQFSSFLYQRGFLQIETALKRCWASGFSARALSYRKLNGLPMEGIKVGVVIQKMVDARTSGVIFSRNPINLFDADHLLNSATFGLGEGLVSGAADADEYLLSRSSSKISSVIAKKSIGFFQDPEGGIKTKPLPQSLQDEPCLNEEQNHSIKNLALLLEEKLGSPQDIEWAYENDQLFCLQTRPITVCPQTAFYDEKINGSKKILWDNANIIESYSGVTSVLTFSFASRAYAQVYRQFLELMGVGHQEIESHEAVFRNMLGHVRGRIYYNLINWYKVLSFLPLKKESDQFMETMMGLKGALPEDIRQELKSDNLNFFQQKKRSLYVLTTTLMRFINKKRIVAEFKERFNEVYEKERKKDFRSLSLPEQLAVYNELENRVLKNWRAPIVNDFLCMIFFGLLKKLTEKWIPGESHASLQNDLLCGQGHLESTEPTKMLMRIAKIIDEGPEILKNEFLQIDAADLINHIRGKDSFKEIASLFDQFLDKYGFRAADELKLEEPDLHQNPSFALSALQNYIKFKSYDIEEMEKRESLIREKAESIVKNELKGLKSSFYNWILKEARLAVSTRENLRFDRTKIFGVVRHLFKAMGSNLSKLEMIEQEEDVFHLDIAELMAFIEGRMSGVSLKDLVRLRKQEFMLYRQEDAPPDRFVTRGTVGIATHFKKALMDGDIFSKSDAEITEPHILKGISCCPGKVVNTVLATNDINEARAVNGRILVTERTDPGWVPLYPSCSGLIIERGSLLSHSAVVARELGLPTIVAVPGLMKRLKTGQTVELDAAKGMATIISDTMHNA